MSAAELGVAEVFRRFADGYCEAHGASMLPSHRRAIADIKACRTEALGGELWGCPDCGSTLHVFHSCRNRSCSQCHGAQTEAWLGQRQAEILPIPYFHVIVTVPKELRAILHRHQRIGYGALFSATGEAIVELARDPTWVGGTVGVLAVLHTWNQQLGLHPHVHCLVTGGGLSEDGQTWHPAAKNFLFPERALGKLIAPRVLSALKKRCPGLDLPAELWEQPFVVHIKRWGEGENFILDYLSRYVFRLAITDHRILAIDDQTVTFEYKDRKSDSKATCTLPGQEFIRRYLQHVLPAGFHKVRYYGLWHCSRRKQREDLRNALLLQRLAEPKPILDPEPPILPAPDPASFDADIPLPRKCPHCQKGYLVLLRSLSPIKAMGP